MFTGIVSDLGKVIQVVDGAGKKSEERTLVLKTSYQDVALGESIAVNGTCLTAVEISREGVLTFYASRETCAKTNLGLLESGHAVNLERAMRLQDRVSGHMVSGHVDGLGTLAAVRPVGDSFEIAVALPPAFRRYTIEKGSITLDGISLTINSIADSTLLLMIIPHTWAHTTLSGRKVGDVFNIELDMIAKYVERITQFHANDSRSH